MKADLNRHNAGGTRTDQTPIGIRNQLYSFEITFQQVAVVKLICTRTFS